VHCQRASIHCTESSISRGALRLSQYSLEKSLVSRGAPRASQYSLDQIINLPRRTAVEPVFTGKIIILLRRTAGKPVFTGPNHQSPAAHRGQASIHWTKSSISRGVPRASQYSLGQIINPRGAPRESQYSLDQSRERVF
jgi:hypothetical protein